MFHYTLNESYPTYADLPKILQNIVLKKPTKSQKEQLNVQKKDMDQELTSFLPTFFIPSNDLEMTKKQLSKSSYSQESTSQKQNIQSLIAEERQRKRKNKLQKNQQIEANNKDDGRGGNCIASNISKTLNRIISSQLKKQVFYKFSQQARKYKIKSQKENTIILLLLLYIQAKQGFLSLEVFEKIFKVFLNSLVDSENNCERKMKTQQSRRNFHLKNKKMYSRFIEINKQLFSMLRKSLSQSQNVTFSLKQLENIISDTYDRKQREIEKAINKIKSIILNHVELQKLFDYSSHNVEEILGEAIQYAYRRNLPKRCKQIKNKIEQVFSYAKQYIPVITAQDKYLLSYIALQMGDDKIDQIWQQFVTNILMKSEFSEDSKSVIALKNLLNIQIPRQYQQISEGKQRQLSNQCKLQPETNRMQQQEQIKADFVTLYEKLREQFQY